MRRTLTLLVAVCLATALLAAPATAGETGIVRPPSIFKKHLAQLKADTGLDVYLPSRLRVFVKPSRVRGEVGATDSSYDLSVVVGRNCGGANACFLANFTGTKGARPAFGRKVKLTGGKTGYWKGVTCGASCSPAEIQWRQGGVRYTIATKGLSQRGEKAGLIRLANSAIEAGPR